MHVKTTKYTSNIASHMLWFDWLIDWLIDYCLTSSEQYLNYIQEKNKFNNI